MVTMFCLALVVIQTTHLQLFSVLMGNYIHSDQVGNYPNSTHIGGNCSFYSLPFLVTSKAIQDLPQNIHVKIAKNLSKITRRVFVVMTAICGFIVSVQALVMQLTIPLHRQMMIGFVRTVWPLVAYVEFNVENQKKQYSATTVINGSTQNAAILTTQNIVISCIPAVPGCVIYVTS